MRSGNSFFKKHLGVGGWSVGVASLALLLFGLALLIWPNITTSVILNLCGAGLAIAGVYNIARYFLRKDDFIAFNWTLSLGLILLLVGLALIIFKGLLLSIVPLLFGIALLICGIAKIQVASNMRRLAYARWYLTMIGAAISTVFGALIIANPFGTGMALVRLIGAAMTVEAVQDMLSYRSYKQVITTKFVH